MGIEIIFIIWLLIIIVIFFLARNYNITWWSSLVLAVFFGLLVLLTALHLPFDCEDDKDKSESWDSSKHFKERFDAGKAILGLISIISVIIVVIYLVQRVFEDKCKLTCETSGVAVQPVSGDRVAVY